MIILLSVTLIFGHTLHRPTVQGWRGIVPLHSTRTDVERLLGPGTNECKCGYYLNDANVFFIYSSFTCRDGAVWEVPPDTVLRITVYPKTHPKFSDLKIDKTKFTERQDGHIENIVTYVNDDEGIVIEVNREMDMVMGFYYEPAARDQLLRCNKSTKTLIQ